MEMKLTTEQINKIKELKKTKTQKEIAILLKIPYATVSYHFSDERKQKAIAYQKKYQKKNPPKRGEKYNEYQRIYQKKRYWRLKNGD